MTKFKDFSAGATSALAEPIVFKLHDQEFMCRPDIQGKTLLTLVGDAASNDAARQAGMIEKFFKTVLVPTSYENFDELTTSEDNIVTIETLGEIIGWIVEQYTNRPTSRPEVSASGQ